ncbi:unnamed protein product [Sympodiomycopsis kandeliae]
MIYSLSPFRSSNNGAGPAESSHAWISATAASSPPADSTLHQRRGKDSQASSIHSQERRIGAGIFVVSKSGPSWVSENRGQKAQISDGTRSASPLTKVTQSNTWESHSNGSAVDDNRLANDTDTRMQPRGGNYGASHDTFGPCDKLHHCHGSDSEACPTKHSSSSAKWLATGTEEATDAVAQSNASERSSAACQNSETDWSDDRSQSSFGHGQSGSGFLFDTSLGPGARLRRNVSGPRDAAFQSSVQSTANNSQQQATEDIHQTHHGPALSNSDDTCSPQRSHEVLLTEESSSAAWSEAGDSSDGSARLRRSHSSFIDAVDDSEKSNGVTYIDQSPIVPSEEENIFWTNGSLRASATQIDSVRQPTPSRESIWQQIEPQELNSHTNVFSEPAMQGSKYIRKNLVLPQVTTMTARNNKPSELRWGKSRASLADSRPPSRRGEAPLRFGSSSALNANFNASALAVDEQKERARSPREQSSRSFEPMSPTSPQWRYNLTSPVQRPKGHHRSRSSRQNEEPEADSFSSSDAYEASESPSSGRLSPVHVFTATKTAIYRADAVKLTAPPSSPGFVRCVEGRVLHEVGIQVDKGSSEAQIADSIVAMGTVAGPTSAEPLFRSRKRPNLRIQTGIQLRSAANRSRAPQPHHGYGFAIQSRSETVQCPQCKHCFGPEALQKSFGETKEIQSTDDRRRLSVAKLKARALLLAKTPLSSGHPLAVAKGHNGERSHFTKSSIAKMATAGVAEGDVELLSQGELTFGGVVSATVHSGASRARVDGTSIQEMRSSRTVTASSPTPLETAVPRRYRKPETGSDSSSMQEYEVLAPQEGSEHVNRAIHKLSSGDAAVARHRPEFARSFESLVDKRGRYGTEGSLTQQRLAIQFPRLPRANDSSSSVLSFGSFDARPSSSQGESSSIALRHLRNSESISIFRSKDTDRGSSVSSFHTASASMERLGTIGSTGIRDTGEWPESKRSGVSPVSVEAPNCLPSQRTAKALKVLGLESQRGMSGHLVNAPDPIVPIHPAARYEHLGQAGHPESPTKRETSLPAATPKKDQKASISTLSVISEPFHVQHVASAEGILGTFPASLSSVAPSNAVGSQARLEMTMTPTPVSRAERLAAGPDASPNSTLQRFKQALRRGKRSSSADLRESFEPITPNFSAGSHPGLAHSKSSIIGSGGDLAVSWGHKRAESIQVVNSASVSVGPSQGNGMMRRLSRRESMDILSRGGSRAASLVPNHADSGIYLAGHTFSATNLRELGIRRGQ